LDYYYGKRWVRVLGVLKETSDSWVLEREGVFGVIFRERRG
jgi:hypothetical protein